jgi:hypothetical protein
MKPRNYLGCLVRHVFIKIVEKTQIGVLAFEQIGFRVLCGGSHKGEEINRIQVERKSQRVHDFY